MNAVAAVTAVLSGPPILTQIGPVALAGPPVPLAGSVVGFPNILASGLNQVATKLDTADDLVRRLALGEDLPVHQVSYALEEARLSVELAMQVRSRLLDGYREMMNLQL